MPRLASHGTKDRPASDGGTGPAPGGLQIDSLVAQLSSSDGGERLTAREDLVRIGKPAVAPLLAALGDHRDHTRRWEAAKALIEIADPRAAPSLVAALEDGTFDIRWLAAEGLIALERSAWPPLLRALMASSESVWLREGAHHVFSAFWEPHTRALLAPVLDALDGIEPELTVPLAAERLLLALDCPGKASGERHED